MYLVSGAAGAAYATVISQGVSGVLCLIYIIKKMPELKLEKSDFQLNGHIAKVQIGIGIPMALQYSITAIGSTDGTVLFKCVRFRCSCSIYGRTNKIEQVLTQATMSLLEQP